MDSGLWCQSYLNTHENSKHKTKQKAQACNAETQSSHFSKTFLEGLIHSNGYVEIEKCNDQDGRQPLRVASLV